jgi:hypothetical protein
MHKLAVSALHLALLCFLALPMTEAQEKPKREAGQGYAFAGFGALNSDSSLLHFGGGAEANLFKGIGFGVEVGYLSPLQNLGNGIGILSIDGQYTFGTGHAGKLRPFLTGGYTLAFRSGHANAVNFGGGVHYWFSRRVGLRMEFRDHVSPSLWDAHLWQGRIGFDFR